LSSSKATNEISIKLDIIVFKVESNIVMEAANEYLSTGVAIMIRNPYEVEALMRFIVTMSLNG
jgi:hypothetical protein